ncbi:MAG: DegT/DnrJ/EryC1/StrS aminotransferase family protein [Eubacteriales bacterium]|nr:DegT/DnrJ/EryC1/StrS aminotransferase family protein [Eubacteriales bacterium]
MAIQLFVPTFDVDACLAQVRECLEKGWTGMGYKTVEFEEAWKKYTGLPHAYYVNSNTAGLNLAVEVLKMQNGWADDDEIITTPLTFVSTNHAIVLGKMKAVFADVDDSLCLDPAEVEKKITERSRAVMYVGFGGNTGRYEDIVELCKKHGLKLILDAAHMAGTRLNGEIPGKEADAVVYSFQAVKNLPTGDSGIICFRDAECDTIVRKLAWLGINKDTYARTISDGGTYKWKYDVEYVGYKDNGNAIMAGIALAQLPHLDKDNAYRRTLAQWYTEGFSPYADRIRLVETPASCESARHLFQIIVEDRDGLMMYLNANEIYPGVHYVDNIEYRMYRYAEGTCPKARYASDHIISLPMHLRLSYGDVRRVIQTILEYLYKVKQ